MWASLGRILGTLPFAKRELIPNARPAVGACYPGIIRKRIARALARWCVWASGWFVRTYKRILAAEN